MMLGHGSYDAFATFQSELGLGSCFTRRSIFAKRFSCVHHGIQAKVIENGSKRGCKRPIPAVLGLLSRLRG